MQRFKGLTVGQIFSNLAQIYNTRRRFQPLTEMTFQHSNFVCKALFICYKRQHPPAL